MITWTPDQLEYVASVQRWLGTMPTAPFGEGIIAPIPTFVNVFRDGERVGYFHAGEDSVYLFETGEIHA